MKKRISSFIILLVTLSILQIFSSACDCDDQFTWLCLDVYGPDSWCSDFCTWQSMAIHYQRWSSGSPPNVITLNFIYGGTICYQTYGRAGSISIRQETYCCDGGLSCLIYSDRVPKPKNPCNGSTTYVKIKLKAQQIEDCPIN